MSDDVKTEITADEQKAVTELGLTEQEVADMDAEYRDLLVRCIATVKDRKVSVAIAALISGAFCVAAENIADQNAARQYILHCVSDAMARLPDAYVMKSISGDENNELSK
jgi:hypothetical protein